MLHVLRERRLNKFRNMSLEGPYSRGRLFELSGLLRVSIGWFFEGLDEVSQNKVQPRPAKIEPDVLKLLGAHNRISNDADKVIVRKLRRFTGFKEGWKGVGTGVSYRDLIWCLWGAAYSGGEGWKDHRGRQARPQQRRDALPAFPGTRGDDRALRP